MTKNLQHRKVLFTGRLLFYVAMLCILSFSSMAVSLPYPESPDFYNSSDNPIAQTIRGKVTDSKNLPLPGVSITVKGNKQGAMTNAAGNINQNKGYSGSESNIPPLDKTE